ncbi:hypothetical protein [Stenotrophomonas sp.]|uniref:hypothetical protein n=1 Tax=Stenotrophomonas sp. TaxID=69392 RepID=UPI0028ABAF34|nr:hypothetical protein [Stenotrophomonas sp.]
MAEVRSRTLHYRRAILKNGDAADLQQLLSAAVAARKDVETREQSMGDGGGTRVISGPLVSHGMFTARLMQYTPGQKQKYFEKDAETGDYKLDTTALPGADASQRREFVESLTLFAVSNSHVMFVATLHLGSKALEDHFTWLLRETGVFTNEDYVLLADQQSQHAEEQLAISGVDGVTIGADLEFEVVETVPTVRKTKDRDTVPGHKLLRPIGPLADALKGLLGEAFADAPLKSALGRQDRIAVTLNLKYSNRHKTDEGFKLMQKLAVAGRHFDDGETTVHLVKGGTLVGSDLKVRTPLSVRIQDSGLIDEIDLWVRIHGWLQQAVATGIVH